MTKTEKLLDVLSTGSEVSVKQIMKKTGLQNPYSTISRLREQGLRIFTNKRNTANGVRYFYRAPAGQF